MDDLGVAFSETSIIQWISSRGNLHHLLTTAEETLPSQAHLPGVDGVEDGSKAMEYHWNTIFGGNEDI